jgi:hypothetical protein
VGWTIQEHKMILKAVAGVRLGARSVEALKVACSTVKSDATMMGMDSRTIEGSAVIPGCLSLAGAAP